MNKYLGIELGSTRIKAAVVSSEFKTLTLGGYSWKSKFQDGFWTYDIDEVWTGIKTALAEAGDLSSVDAAGVSGMMHGYLVFDKDWNLLAPFRTWQNIDTVPAASELTELFGFNIPYRWSIAHIYQAILNGEEHIKDIAHVTTLAGYVHFMLTGEHTVGVGEASGIFPIDSTTLDYDASMLDKFDALIEKYSLLWNIRDVLPKVLPAGECAGKLTEEGSKKIDRLLPVGTPFAPPEGDADTGMVCTNAVAPKTGNVSAGTSIFSMVVLDRPLSRVYKEIGMVMTPSGKPVAMVHCSNCTNDSNAWVSLLRESMALFGDVPADSEFYTKLYKLSLEGDSDCGGVTVCNFIQGEAILGLPCGVPMVVRSADSNFTLANFFRATLYSTMAGLKIGMEILEREGVEIESLTGHGGLFKTPLVGQRYMAAAFGTAITCMESAGEGGPFGMAVLAAYMTERKEDEKLEEFLNTSVFKNTKSTSLTPDEDDVKGFNLYMGRYKKLLEVERKAIETL